MTDLSRLDATAQADLVRKGDASPLELVDAAINNIEKLNPELNAVIHPLFDSAARGRAGRAARRPVPRRADSLQGSDVRSRRRPAARRHAIPEAGRLAQRPHRSARAPLPRRRLRVRRPHEHARARARPHDGAGGLRAHAQPVGHRAHAGRDRAADRRPRSPAEWSRSPTPTTAADRSVSRRAAAGWWG